MQPGNFERRLERGVGKDQPRKEKDDAKGQIADGPLRRLEDKEAVGRADVDQHDHKEPDEKGAQREYHAGTSLLAKISPTLAW